MSKYKLIEELGLKVEIGMKVKKRQKRIGFVDVVSADELEWLLKEALVVNGSMLSQEWRLETKQSWPDQTHTARLIGIKKIKEDTAEGLLMDYVTEYEKFKRGESNNISVEPWVKRVLRLLGEK